MHFGCYSYVFVAMIQERLEYAMAEILDLLNMGRTRSNINPEVIIDTFIVEL